MFKTILNKLFPKRTKYVVTIQYQGASDFIGVFASEESAEQHIRIMFDKITSNVDREAFQSGNPSCGSESHFRNFRKYFSINVRNV